MVLPKSRVIWQTANAASDCYATPVEDNRWYPQEVDGSGELNVPGLRGPEVAAGDGGDAAGCGERNFTAAGQSLVC